MVSLFERVGVSTLMALLWGWLCFDACLGDFCCLLGLFIYLFFSFIYYYFGLFTGFALMRFGVFWGFNVVGFQVFSCFRGSSCADRG